MERSGSIAPSQGWHPLHVALYRGTTLCAVAPLYLKEHSWGEFVFDFVWQQAAASLNKHYFPKLVGMVPATPSSAYRFLIAEEEDCAALQRTLLDAIDQLAEQIGAHSCAFNYPDRDWMREIEGYHTWAHEGFCWYNEHYQTFDDFHCRFRKNQRRNVRRERAELSAQPFEVKIIPAAEAPPSYDQQMYKLYALTNQKFGPFGAQFLNQRFFDTLRAAFGHRILYCCALPTSGGSEALPVAMSMLVYKNDHLYGRYWGTESYVNALHFNLCYYEPLEWAIRHRIRLFDPGMGSPHKIKRGFQAVANYSLHKLYDAELNALMAYNIDDINRNTARHLEQLNQELPFKQSPE